MKAGGCSNESVHIFLALPCISCTNEGFSCVYDKCLGFHMLLWLYHLCNDDWRAPCLNSSAIIRKVLFSFYSFFFPKRPQSEVCALLSHVHWHTIPSDWAANLTRTICHSFCVFDKTKQNPHREIQGSATSAGYNRRVCEGLTKLNLLSWQSFCWTMWPQSWHQGRHRGKVQARI